MGALQSRSAQEAEEKFAKLQAEAQKLKQQTEEQKKRLAEQSESLEATKIAHAEQLSAKETSLRVALAKQRVAEEARINDALLTKRLLYAQREFTASRISAEGQAGLAAYTSSDDILQVKDLLVRSVAELEATHNKVNSLEAAARASRWTALSREICLPDLTDVSIKLRSTHGLFLAGLRAPQLSTWPLLS